jgi:RNA polymerase sigma factor (sigma-70 family)
MANRHDYSELQLYLRKIRRYPLLQPEEEYSLAKQYQQGDVSAGQKIIHANLRFVVKVSQKYFNSGHNYLEIVQEGNLGLMKALTRFDPDRGVHFIYYAVWWIEASIKDFIRKSSKIRTGTLRHTKDLLSLDETIAGDPSETDRWVDYLTDDFDLESLYSGREISRQVSFLFQQGFTMLTRRELFIILKRFYSDPPVTLMEIGSQLGLSQERVRQLQVRSLQKMKQFLEDQDISTLSSDDLRAGGNGDKTCRLAGQ